MQVVEKAFVSDIIHLMRMRCVLLDAGKHDREGQGITGIAASGERWFTCQ